MREEIILSGLVEAARTVASTPVVKSWGNILSKPMVPRRHYHVSNDDMQSLIDALAEYDTLDK